MRELPVLMGPRTVLRAVRPADGPDYVAATLRNRALHHPWTNPPTTIERFVERLGWVDETLRVFVLRAREGGALVGTFELSQIVMGAFCSAYLGYSGFAPHTGRGLMGEGLALVVHMAFEAIGLHRIEANIQPENVRSIALVRRGGFEREGYSPGYLKVDGAWRAHERWAMRREIFAPPFTPAVEGG